MFSRIQNLHISQTLHNSKILFPCLVEFKIYISLKHLQLKFHHYFCLVEFKIYISLKQALVVIAQTHCLVEFKIYISLKHE